MEIALASLGDLLPDPVHGGRQTEAERHRSLIEQAVLAEELGFDAVHLGEHHFSDYMLSCPPVVLAAIGERTSALRLGTAVTLAGNLDPVRAAEDYATVDVLTGGRVEVVAGRGSPFVDTYRGFGQPIETGRGRYDENVRLLARLLTETDVTWSGQYRSGLEGFTTRPRPFGSMPIWVGAGSKESIRLAAEIGAWLMLPSVFGRPEMFRVLVDLYHEVWVEQGRDEADARVGAISHTHVAATTAEARRRWEPYYRNYWAFVGGLLVPGFPWPAFEYDSLLTGPAICGSPEQVIDRMGEWKAMLGLDRHLFMFDLGGIDRGLLTETIELFGAEVLPALKAL